MQLFMCGEDIFYMHVEEDGSVLSLDDNSLSDMPEYDGCEPELLVGAKYQKWHEVIKYQKYGR